MAQASETQTKTDYSDPKFVEAIREYNQKNEILTNVKELSKLVQSYNDSIELLKDETFKEMAETELKEIETILKS